MAFAGIAALLVSGCAGSGSEADKSTGTGGTLTVGWTQYPPNLNPALGQSNYVPFYYLAYEPLVVAKPDGTYSAGLATKWGYIGSGNTEYELALRGGVKFSDGTALTADSVKNWIDYEKKQASTAGEYLANVSSVDVTGLLTLTIHLAKADPNLTYAFSQSDSGAGYVASQGAVSSPGKLNSATYGAGPYVLLASETVAGDHYTYVPNRYFWDQSQIKWQKIVLKVIANPTSMVNALRADQIQVAWGDGNSIDAAESARALVVTGPHGPGGLLLVDRGGTLAKPLSDLRVRQALNLALDRAAIVKAVYPGFVTTEQYAVKGQEAYDAALTDPYPYDPGKAKQLLAEAGYPHGFDLAVLSSSLVGLDTLAQAISGYLSKIGVTLKITSASTSAEFLQKIAAKSVPSFVLALPVTNTSSIYSNFGQPGSFGNPFATTNAGLSSAIAQYDTAPPGSASAASLARQINSILVSQAWDVPIFWSKSIFFENRAVSGLRFVGAGIPDILDVVPA